MGNKRGDGITLVLAWLGEVRLMVLPRASRYKRGMSRLALGQPIEVKWNAADRGPADTSEKLPR